MTDVTPRHGLPLLVPGQYQKELFHNEALLAADALLHPAVASISTGAAPADPVAGQGFIVGAGAGGAWQGQQGRLAVASAGGWRFLAPAEGLTVWVIDAGCPARFAGGAWTLGIVAARELRIEGARVVGARGAPVADPVGGGTVDAELRATVAALLQRLRQHGLIAT